MILLDTSGLLCYHHADEPGHEVARALLDAPGRKVTHSYVLSELVTLAHVRRLSRRRTVEFVITLIESPVVEVVWVDETLHRSGMDLLAARADKNYSLCDAVSFALMRERRLLEALTTDHHFEQEGFVRLLR